PASPRPRQRRFGDLGCLAETMQRNPRSDLCGRLLQLLSDWLGLLIDREVTHRTSALPPGCAMPDCATTPSITETVVLGLAQATGLPRLRGSRSNGGERRLSAAAPGFCYLLAQTMIIAWFPMVVRLDHCGWLDTRLRVCYRPVRIQIERHAHRVSRALVEVRGLHVLTLRG